jgi:hypothetical protein|tara:strand:- start:16629 stop:17279 length:651 start_codon:yes stop_codon:yes gene_type:complete
VDSFALTIDNAVDDTRFIDKLYHLINTEGQTLGTGNFIKYEEFVDPLNYDSEIDYIVKEITRKLWFNKLSWLIKSKIPTNPVGFEIWVNSLPETSFNNSSLAGGVGGLNYHLDKDEGSSDLRLPLFGTALYLGPREGINGGEIMINTRGLEHFESYQGGLIDLNDTENWIEIPFKFNRMVVFDPHFPHFVKPVIAFPEGKKRLCIAINVWDQELSS